VLCLCRLISDSNGDSLCDNGVSLSFTNFTWPVGVKRDRGLNITFTKDIILPPGGWLGARSGGVSGANVAISFKDAKNNFRCGSPVPVLLAECRCSRPCPDVGLISLFSL
jgi:hypothetical protein